MQTRPKFQEEYSAKLPALTLLTNLGCSFTSPAHHALFRKCVPRTLEQHMNKSFMIGAKRLIPLAPAVMLNDCNHLAILPLHSGAYYV